MFIMFKIYVKRLLPLLWFLGLGALLLTFFFPAHVAHAEAARKGHLEITNPLVNGTPQGRPGTSVTVQGSNFDGNSSITLYYTTNGDQGQCTNNGNPGDHGLQQFTNNGTVTAQDDGTFTQSITWPDAANSPNTQYYICALSDNVHALSTNAFTVIQNNGTVDFNPKSAAPGDTITVTGSGWTPPKLLNVSIANGDNTNPIASKTVTPGTDGNFSVQLTVPASAQPGTYNILVVAVSDATQQKTMSNALTITQAAPTPTPTTAPTPTAVSSPTATPTPVSTGSTGGGGGLTMLIYALGGVGVMLVIVGAVMFAAYSRS